MPSTKPANWLPEHDAFVRRHARNGEDPESILILFETEYPTVRMSKAWIVEVVKKASKAGGAH